MSLHLLKGGLIGHYFLHSPLTSEVTRIKFDDLKLIRVTSYVQWGIEILFEFVRMGFRLDIGGDTN